MLGLKFTKDFGNLLILQVPFLICAFWALPRSGKKIKAAFTEKIYHQLWLIIFLNFALGLVLNLFLPMENVIPKQVETFQAMGIIPAFLLTCLVAPIAEECFFRFTIFDNFTENNLLPYLLSFFGFIIMHIGWFNFTNFSSGIFQLFNYCLSAFYLIYIYRISGGNLTFPMVVHFLNNLTFLIVVFTRYQV